MGEAANFNWSTIGGVGLYPVPLVSRLLNEKPKVVRSWIDGYTNSGADPIIHRQLPRIGDRTVFGFLDLIEARFIKHFCDLGLSPQSIRKVANKLRSKHGETHPFATKNRFRTDGRKIFLEVVETEDERRIIDVLTDNFEMVAVIDPSLFDSILYSDDLAYRWRPSPQFPSIVLDPKIAFGKPVVDHLWVTTHALYSAFRVEGDFDAVADEFRLAAELVQQAVDFERYLTEHQVH